jgi:hypothetical protein
LALPAVSHFSATAAEKDGVLQGTLWSPVGFFHPGRPHLGAVAPLATFGTARDRQSGVPLWQSLLEQGGLPPRDPPGAPWCALLPDSKRMAAHPQADLWLADLQCSIAFAWLARKPGPRSPSANECTAAR